MSFNTPPYQSYNRIPYKRQLKFIEWFNSAVTDTFSDPPVGMRKITHGEYINYFRDELVKILHNNRMNIKNEKEFKKDITTFVYRTSA